MNGIKIIELDCAYEQFENERVRQVFGELLNMRKRGYSSRHSTGALPVDTCDFIATHYLMATEEGDELKVLGGVRMMKYSQTQFYNLPFPVVSLLTAAKANRHLNYVTDRMNPTHQIPEFTYVSSWSFDPSVRSNPELYEYLYQLFCTIQVYSHLEPQNEVRFACGIPRLKTDQYIIGAGYEKISDAEGLLPEVNQSNLLGEPVILLELKNGHNFAYRRAAQAHAKLWNEREVYHHELVTEQKKAG